MSVEQTNIIDLVTIDKASGDVWLTISDHLPWEANESDHLILLQEKLNAYPRFVQSGEVVEKYPDASGRKIVFNFVGKFPLSKQAEIFLTRAESTIEGAGLKLQIGFSPPN